jgi:adenylate kinase family enzyme
VALSSTRYADRDGSDGVVEVSEIGSALRIGRRVVFTGMAGAGKSTFARQLSAKTGLPVIHLDLHFWKPGWVQPSVKEWRDVQSKLLAGEEWIADGNYHETLDLRLERADSVVFLDTQWRVCAARAFVRGLRRPEGYQLPDGCDASAWRRLRDEWWLVWRVWLGRRSGSSRQTWRMNRYGGLRLTSRVMFCGVSHGAQACAMAGSDSGHGLFDLYYFVSFALNVPLSDGSSE